jgi:hypothetical protein
MTRTHKVNSINHQAIAEGFPRPQNIPKFFGKSGFADQNPKKTKKNGGGRANWGNVGDEVIDDDEFNFTKARRRSNSSSISNHQRELKSKFDINETEPVFEESIHGPEDEEFDDADKSETGSSASA